MKSTEITDFNDLAKAKGIQAVHDLVANVIANPPTKVEEVAEEEKYKVMEVGAHVPVPDLLTAFPVGILNEISEWIEGFSFEPQPQITQFTALAIASTLCGRNYVSEGGNTSSLFLMVLGETGVGKNYAKTSTQNFFDDVGMTNLLSGSGNTSSGAVFTSLVQAPCHIQIVDEIGKQLQTARKQSNGMMAEAFSTLVECYSSTTTMLTPKNYSNMSDIVAGKNKDTKKVVVRSPAITLLGLATPAQVYDNLSTVEIEDGFLNRLIVCDVTLPQKPEQMQMPAPVPRHIAQWANLIRNPSANSLTSLSGIEMGYDIKPIHTTVKFDTGVKEIFMGYRRELKEREANGEFALPDMTRRWNENAMRLATCMAVCENALEPLITPELAQWSIMFVEYYGNEFMLNAATKVSDSDFHSLYLKVKEFIERSGEDGMTESELSRNCRAYAASAPNQRDQVLLALVRENCVQQMTIKTLTGRGRPRQVWIACDNVTQNVLNRSK